MIPSFLSRNLGQTELIHSPRSLRVKIEILALCYQTAPLGTNGSANGLPSTRTQAPCVE